jgi:hypothetical protein
MVHLFGDVQAGVRGLHIASCVLAGAAGGNAQEVPDLLPDSDLGIGAQADEEAALFGVSGQASHKVIGNGGEGVIAPRRLYSEAWAAAWGAAGMGAATRLVNVPAGMKPSISATNRDCRKVLGMAE